MNERKFDHGSRINIADEGALECSVGANMFESPNDGLVGEPITPSAAARSAAFVLQIVAAKVRDILHDRLVRSPHRRSPSSSFPC
jgi:hypothetical protein